MSNLSITVTCCAVSVALLLVGAARWRSAIPRESDRSLQSDTRNSTAPFAALTDSLANVEDVMVANDPFRLSSTASNVRYDPAADGLADAAPRGPPAAAARPVLVLKAIVGGPPWQAVIDGIPGQPAGTVATTGATFGSLTFRAVTRDSVIVQGTDTLWTLTFRTRS